MAPTDRHAIASAFAEEQLGKNPDISAIYLTGSAARNDGVESSDIDIKLLVPDLGGRPAKPDPRTTWREGIFIDAAYVPSADFRNAAELLKDPYLASSINDAVILFDSDGELTRVRRAVVEQFMESRWLGARVASLASAIKRNHARALDALREPDKATTCQGSSFALWTTCELLLVSQGVAPTWVRGLHKLGVVLPAECERIFEIEGASAMTPLEVSRLIPFYVEAVNPGPGALHHAQKETEWMIRNSLHREALHSLWIGVALGLRSHMESGRAESEELATDLAQRWLSSVGWDDAKLGAKVTDLGEYIDGAIQLAVGQVISYKNLS
ncbi:hypothetical protein ACFL6X_03780 [Candidatus Latescibacterota bacterium]